MIRRFILLCLLICLSVLGHAQKENNSWVFGHTNGLNFNNNPPTFFQNSLTTLEGSASICDANGALLFYSNGNKVWNAGGAVMPNGSGIQGNSIGSASKGVAIIKSVANPNQYYLFTLDEAEDITQDYPGYLRYSLIDMSLDAGNGDVVAGTKNIVLDTFMEEKMIVTKGIGCSYWLVTHRNNTTAYRSFKVDATGIHPGVSSDGYLMGNMGAGDIKVSSDGSKIVMVSSMNSGFEIGNFDKATGMVNNMNLIDSAGTQIGMGTAFSPDNNKLYISFWDGIYQYDLSSYPNISNVMSSRKVITANMYGQLRNGPDGKIYIASWASPFISVINDPNTIGTGCNFDGTALPQPSWANLFPGSFSAYGYGLGNDIVMVGSDVVGSHLLDTLICLLDTFKINAPAGYESYTWNDGSTTTFKNVTADGLYILHSNSSCESRVDSFKINMVDFGKGLGPDTFICDGSTLQLDPGTEGGLYLWQDGSTDPTMDVSKAGTYSVIIAKDNCIRTETIHIQDIIPNIKILDTDTLICYGDQTTLTAVANPVSHFLWSNGATNDFIIVDKSDLYTVTATNACGTFMDSIHIISRQCDCQTFIPNAFTPNNDQLNDVFKVQIACHPTNYFCYIYNRYGEQVFAATAPESGWDGTYKGKISEMGTYFYYLSFFNSKGEKFERKGSLELLR